MANPQVSWLQHVAAIAVGKTRVVGQNSPRPQRGQGRSDLFSKENLRFSPPPPPCRPPTPTHVGWTQNPVRRALKFSGFVGVQLHGSIFVENVLLSCLRLGSGPAQPATRLLARPVSPTQPQAQACLKQTYPKSSSKPSPAPSPGPRPAPRSGLSNANDPVSRV